MAGTLACRCPGKKIDPIVLKRNYNTSAFNGYHRTYSAYSTVLCIGCGAIGRTKAKYVDRAPDAPAGWVNMSFQKLAAWKREHHPKP